MLVPFGTGAGLPGHPDALTDHPRDPHGEKVLAEFVGRVLPDHLGIGPEAARGDDDRLGLDLHLVGLALDEQPRDDASLLQELLGRLPEVELHAELLGPVGHAFHHGARGHGSSRTAVRRRHLVVGGIRAAHVRLDGAPHHAHLLQPVDGVRRLVDEVGDQAGINAPVGVVHEDLEGLLARQRRCSSCAAACSPRRTDPCPCWPRPRWSRPSRRRPRGRAFSAAANGRRQTCRARSYDGDVGLLVSGIVGSFRSGGLVRRSRGDCLGICR